jgi:ABC-type transport system involved in multi-copper enzyme maturation permease subunit
MLWYKAWRESSVRFCLGVSVLICMCLTYTLFYKRLYPGFIHDHPAMHTYTQYIHWNIFGGTTRGMLQLSCLLLGLGGLQRDRKQDTLGFTLSLPVSRVRLVVSRATLGFIQIFVLSLLTPFVVSGVSIMMGYDLPLSYGLRFVPLWTIGGILTYSVSFLCSVLFTNEYVSLVSAYMVYMFYLAAVRYPRLSQYHLHIADFMSGLSPGYVNRSTMLWNGTYPITPLVGFGVAGIVIIALGVFATTRQDL